MMSKSRYNIYLHNGQFVDILCRRFASGAAALKDKKNRRRRNVQGAEGGGQPHPKTRRNGAHLPDDPPAAMPLGSRGLGAQPPIRVEGRKPPIGGNGGREAPNAVEINKCLNIAKPLRRFRRTPGRVHKDARAYPRRSHATTQRDARAWGEEKSAKAKPKQPT